MRARLLFSSLIAALLIPLGVTAQAQPLTASASVFRQVFANGNVCTIVAHNCVAATGYDLFVMSNVTVDNLSGNVTPVADFTAGADKSTCTYSPTYSCTSWSAPSQIVSPTALQMDPLGNSASFTATLRDSVGTNHSINITLSRPTNNGVGMNNPNAWVDGQSAQVSVNYLGFGRSGYVLSGVFDSTTPLNTSCDIASGICGYSGGSTTQATYNSFVQAN